MRFTPGKTAIIRGQKLPSFGQDEEIDLSYTASEKVK
jgi:hypothetical protein